MEVLEILEIQTGLLLNTADGFVLLPLNKNSAISFSFFGHKVLFVVGSRQIFLATLNKSF